MTRDAEFRSAWRGVTGIALTAALAVLSCIPTARGQAQAAEQPLAKFMTLESPITEDLREWVRAGAAELQAEAARQNRKAFLILEIPTGVSQFHLVYGMAELLTSQSLQGVTTVAWVPQTVTGPNVLIALACNEIVMHPDAQLGDLGRGRALPASEQAIVRSVVSKRVNGRVNEALATAMMDPQSTLLMLTLEPAAGQVEKRLATEDEARRLRESQVPIRDSRTIKEPGSVGLFSGAQARHDEMLIARAAASRREVADGYGLPEETLRETPRTSRGTADQVVLIEVHGMIEPILASFLNRQIERSVDAGAKTLIFEITSPGGYLQHSLDLANAIADLEKRGVRTVAYIPNAAISGAAIIALGCDEIYLTPNAKMGDAGPIEVGKGGVFERAPEKILSLLRDEMRTLANRKQRPAALAEAMCDKDLEVYEVVHKTKGSVWYMTEDEFHHAGDEWSKGRPVPEARGNLLLTVNGKRANELKLAEPPVSDFEELKQRLGVPAEVTPVRAKRIWVDDLVFWLNRPWVVGALFFLAIVCVYIELHTMTGAMGLISALCFVLFFWSKWLGGTAGGLELLLFGFGVFALAMEIFVIPGVGVFGVTGVLAMVASLVMASQTFSLVDQGRSFDDATKTLGTLGISIVAVAGVAVAISRYLPRIPFLKDMILSPPGMPSLTSPDEPRLRPDSTVGGESLIGRQGQSRTMLRPAGKAEIDGRLLDVVSDGEMIPAGTPVEIVQVQGNRVIVRSSKGLG
ncbi:MAG: hypothetical protein KF774_11540 [Planctomyces sp.]|nr:hypothetical protein [Planctomyces sp.]